MGAKIEGLKAPHPLAAFRVATQAQKTTSPLASTWTAQGTIRAEVSLVLKELLDMAALATPTLAVLAQDPVHRREEADDLTQVEETVVEK